MSVCVPALAKILSSLMPATFVESAASVLATFFSSPSAVTSPVSTASLIGWTATAVFATSYLASKVSWMTRIQAAASCIWIAYGIKIGAPPVIVANVIVATAALITSFRSRRTATE